jgi:hypothetical protein
MHFSARQSKATNAPSHTEASRSLTRPVPSNHPLDHPLLELQGAIGNQRMQRLVHSQPVQGLRPSQGGLLQRKCACGGTPGLDGECAACREKRLSRQPHSTSQAEPATVPPIVHEVLSSPGQPLDLATRAFMEPRFGHDFSRVRVHADAKAAESACAVNALAYTVGQNIVFEAEQYMPRTTSGRQLLAHELAHVIQQEGKPKVEASKLNIGQSDGSHEYEADEIAEAVVLGQKAQRISLLGPEAHLQRAISPQMPRIRENLTTSFFSFNWFITEEDVHEVLMILRTLSDDDLRDTVAAMEREELVEPLFEHVSETDRSAEAETLQRVQNFRVHTRTVTSGSTTVTMTAVGSCSPEQANILTRAIETALPWLNLAINRLNHFIALPLNRSTQDVALALRTHFNTQNPFHAELVRDRLQAIEREATSRKDFASECAAPTDPLCAELAGAYVRPGSPTPVGVRWCPGFFRASEDWRVKNIIHESAHGFVVQVGGANFVKDRGYFDERVYQYLRPEEAMDNADSYARLAQELATGRPLSSESEGRPRDEIADCPAGADEIVRPALARAARWNLNAVTVLASPNSTSSRRLSALRRTHFGTDDPARIRELLEIYQRARRELDRDIPFECEAAGGVCRGSTIGYFRYFLFITSDVLHLCPSWFGLGDQQRIESIYALVLSHDAGVSEEDRHKYVNLARDLTELYWRVPPSLPTEPFPTSTVPGTEIA